VAKPPDFYRGCYTLLMLNNIKVSIHIALVCLVALLYASIARADCAQQSTLGTTLPPCKPAASAPCYIVGSNGEICASEPANNFAVDEWNPESKCYAEYGICERDDSGVCGWRSSDDLSQCIANMRSGIQESIQPCTLCPATLQQICQ
jgi:hypothetical protein